MFCPVVETDSFVKLLFDVLSSGDYDADLKAKRASSAGVATQQPSVLPVSQASASNSASSVGSHGDVDMRTGRPGAVVQPLVSDGTSKDKDYRHDDVYRPGPEVHHHGESQQRRHWKRRSPQRTVRRHQRLITTACYTCSWTGCLTLLEILEIYWNNFPILEIYWKLAKSPGNFLADSKLLYFTVYQ